MLNQVSFYWLSQHQLMVEVVGSSVRDVIVKRPTQKDVAPRLRYHLRRRENEKHITMGIRLRLHSVGNLIHHDDTDNITSDA